MNAYIQRLFDAYGPRRYCWGADITNGSAKASHRERLTHFTEELKFFSDHDKDWIGARNPGTAGMELAFA